VEKRRKEGEVTEAGGAGCLGEAVRQARLRAAPSVQEFKYNKKRVRLVSQGPDLKEDAQGIVYWMSRDQRVQDNWAFLYAQRLALKQKLPLHVCFCLVPHFGFMLKGLQEVAEECKELAIPFHLLVGFAKDVLPPFVTGRGLGGGAPLRVPAQWVEDVRERLPGDVPFVQVDAHNIVPCWVASDKQEYGARTIRRKIHDRLSEFLTEFPPVIKHPYPPTAPAEPIDWSACRAGLQVDHTVKEVTWATPGTAAGLAMLESFIGERLKFFGTDRNNPNRAALSNLSPWFHFGQVSVQRAILEVRKHRGQCKESVEGFVEEAVVRRELQTGAGFSLWRQPESTLSRGKPRPGPGRPHPRGSGFSSPPPELPGLPGAGCGSPGCPRWALPRLQLQMVHEGKMHGFLRMYWAKKILEWTRSPEEALKFAIYLNDRYELDGRDPSGYVGCMWSICGLHDQGWAERAVFGKIRYMNYAGCKRKFDVGEFERRYHPRK
uniref:Deoxyribodipyrimidine photo-lyase n=1 Tax=Pelodiscus sinensis TaxID=13735 RepID=K7F2M8_PELSI